MKLRVVLEQSEEDGGELLKWNILLYHLVSGGSSEVGH